MCKRILTLVKGLALFRQWNNVDLWQVFVHRVKAYLTLHDGCPIDKQLNLLDGCQIDKMNLLDGCQIDKMNLLDGCPIDKQLNLLDGCPIDEQLNL